MGNVSTWFDLRWSYRLYVLKMSSQMAVVTIMIVASSQKFPWRMWRFHPASQCEVDCFVELLTAKSIPLGWKPRGSWGPWNSRVSCEIQ